MTDKLTITDSVLTEGINAVARSRGDLGEATTDADHVAGCVGHARLESTLRSFSSKWRITRTKLTDSMSKLETNLRNVDDAFTKADVVQRSTAQHDPVVPGKQTIATQGGAQASYDAGGGSRDGGLTPMSPAPKSGGSSYVPGGASAPPEPMPSSYYPVPDTSPEPIVDPAPGVIDNDPDAPGGEAGDRTGGDHAGDPGDDDRGGIGSGAEDGTWGGGDTPGDGSAPGGSNDSDGPIGEPLPDSPGLGGSDVGGGGAGAGDSGGAAPIGEPLAPDLGALDPDAGPESDGSPLDPMAPLGALDSGDAGSDEETGLGTDAAAATEAEGGFNPAIIAAGLAGLGLASGAASILGGRGDEEAVAAADSDRVRGAREAIEELRRNRGGSGDPT